MIYAYPDYTRAREFSAEVLVVGTGAGGAVVGAELAEAGVDVLFVEEGAWFPTSAFNPYMRESVPRLYRDAATTVILGQPPITYVEGRCVGGSTTVNGGMCYRTPEPVLDEWQRWTGSADFRSEALEPLFERVEERISVRPDLDLALGDDSRIMYHGARRKGWCSTINQRDASICVGCNNCVMGCPTGAKQSTNVSYMPRAMEAGARCLTEIRVDRLLIEGGRCVGVVGHAQDPRTRRGTVEVTVRARAVVISCGAVQTPYLLLRHRLGRPSGQLGRNFLIHPNAKLVAFYPHEVRGWQGMSQFSQVREFRDDGILLAENFAPPSTIAANQPFVGREVWDYMRRYNNAVLCGVLVEDSTSGRIRRGPLGMVHARYDITDSDYLRFLRGVRLMAELHFGMGADALLLPFTNRHWARSMDDLADLEPRRQPKATLELFTPHLMGTARLGPSPESSVVDLDGRVWDMPGCYVADASIFPSAIGVNPQVTIMALATRIASALAERLRSQRAA